jgi:phosphate transport system substrate-binding protein
MTNSLKLIIGCTVVMTVFVMCNRTKTGKLAETDTGNSGKIKILADESFGNILEQERYIFKSLYTAADPQLIYKSETELVKLLLTDSIRAAIMSRELNADEAKLMASRTLPAETTPFAVDAVTVIVNQASNDTLMSVDQVKAMLNGKAFTDKNIVFDNPNSSLVRYLKNLSGNQALKLKNIYALNTNKDVIKYVSTHQNAIGIVGFSWLVDPDADYADAVNKVKVVGIKGENNDKGPTKFFKPSQESLALKQYPLSRKLYVIDCTGRAGLAAAFGNFMRSDRGQRIILRSGLLPDSIPSREINVK